MGGPSAQEKADIVRRAFEGFQHLQLDQFTQDWHEDVVWDMAGYENWPGEKLLYEGEAEVISGFAGYLGAIKGLHVSDLEVTALEDGRVLGIHRERRLDDNDRESHKDIGTIYEFAADEPKIVRVEVHTGRANARRAAGLTE
jgi:ketosteroid isomerase-like protein